MIVPKIITGDILKQKVEVIVNPWNRNIVPWWLLLPQGVSGAIKKYAGTAPFKELAKAGRIPLGGAVLTGSGKLPFKGIIHVAGINMFWRATDHSIRNSVINVINIAKEFNFKSVAFPLIGTGSGSFKKGKSIEIMLDQLAKLNSDAKIIIVKFDQDHQEKIIQ